jgi:hypothetical protein
MSFDSEKGIHSFYTQDIENPLVISERIKFCARVMVSKQKNQHEIT